MAYSKRLGEAAEMTRRDFTKAAAATAALAAAGISMGSSTVKADEAQVMTEDKLALAAQNLADWSRDLTTGEWVPAACWHNCGGRCVNKVLVRDGIVIRQKTDDSVEDTVDNPQQRGCVRGRSQRMQVFGPDRIKYPMKRKSWSPDDPHGELRGRDEWERISWDEALDTIAAELQKAYGTYGPASVLSGANKALNITLGAMGGACTVTDTSSCGTLSNGTAAKMGLGFLNWFFVVNDRYDLKNAEYIVLEGANPAWTASGMPINNYLQANMTKGTVPFGGFSGRRGLSPLGGLCATTRHGARRRCRAGRGGVGDTAWVGERDWTVPLVGHKTVPARTTG